MRVAEPSSLKWTAQDKLRDVAALYDARGRALQRRENIVTFIHLLKITLKRPELLESTSVAQLLFKTL